MKKLYAFFLLLLVIVIKASGQGTDNPILPRIFENGYSISQIQNFALENNSFSKSYRIKLLAIVNEGLRKSGEYVNINGGQPLNEGHITWIYEQVTRKENGYLPAGYSNTWRNGNSVSSCIGKKAYYGAVDQFIFGQCLINLDKPSCANLLGDVEYLYSNPITKPVKNYSTEEKQIGTVVSGKPIDLGRAIMDMPTQNQTNSIVYIKEKTWFGRNWPWIAGVAVASATATYFILKNQQNVNSGGPGGAPISHDPINPPDPPNPGGPGGAPITH